jgi:hypothetical protein
MTGIFFVMYHVPNALIALRGSAWPKDTQDRSYFVTKMCGAASDVACPDPRVPFPRGTSSIVIGPDGKTHGLLAPVAPALKSTP